MDKCLRDAARLPSFPHVTRDGDWLVSEHARWTGGFFVGMLWLTGLQREDPSTLETARDWAVRLTPARLGPIDPRHGFPV